jgi:tetratricopeptide (TPR) repeat protein
MKVKSESRWLTWVLPGLLYVPVIAISPAVAQAPAGRPAVVMEKGEVMLDGKITAMLGGGSFDIKAVAYTTPSGKTIEFDEPKSKSISWPETTTFAAREDLKRTLNARSIKLGSFVSVVGRDKGPGTPLQARLILVWGAGNGELRNYGRGQQINRLVSILLSQGKLAHQQKNYETAVKLLTQARTTAQGTNDAAGEVLVCNQQILLYSDMKQGQKCEDAYESGLKVALRTGMLAEEALLHNNIAMYYARADNLEKATALLERAVEARTQSGQLDALPTILGNLGSTYLKTEQKDKALATFRRALPLVLEENIATDVVDAQTSIGLLVPLPASRAEALEMATRALARLNDIADDKKRARHSHDLGKLHVRLGLMPKATELLNQALTIYQNAGDKESEAKVQKTLDEIKNPQAAEPTPAKV